MDIRITKKDIIWSYLAQFFNLATGLITLPLILKLFTPEEVGFNYVLISINSIVVLFDMGFSGQFSRYLTYIFSGAQKILKEGIPDSYSENINEHLLACTIETAKRIYLYISLSSLICLLSLGSWYAYSITEGFSIIDNAHIVWGIFCISSFFNIYYLYYNAFLQGKGLIKESRQAQVFSRICYILIIFVMILLGCGLLSVVVANLISPFIFRFIAFRKFFTKDIVAIISNNHIEKSEIKDTFLILFFNAKKMGFIGILSSALGYASTLVIGKYMSLSDVGSYGLMVQLVGIVAGLATIHYQSIAPEVANLMVKHDSRTLKTKYGFSVFVFAVVFISGFILLLIAPVIFERLKFNTHLPSYSIIIFYCIYKFFEQNQSIYSNLFLINNDFRFYPAAITTGILSFICLYGSLLCGMGLLGVVLSQAIPLFAYSAWKWPIEATRYFNINTKNDIIVSPILQIKNKIYGQYF